MNKCKCGYLKGIGADCCAFCRNNIPPENKMGEVVPSNEHAAHHKLGASVAKRWMNCPGSVRLIESLPEEMKKGGSEYASEGTLAHELLAWRLLNPLAPLPKKYQPGAGHKVDGFKVKVTEEMWEAVQVCVDLVEGLIKEYKLDRNKHLHVEKRVYVPGVGFGTVDIMLEIPFRKLIVIDYKHGKGVAVDVDENEQAIYYSIGGLLLLPQIVRDELPLVENIICQPRCPGAGVQRSLMEQDEIWAWHKRLQEGAVATEAPDAPLSPGSWCKFCPAGDNGKCNAQLEEMAAEYHIDEIAPALPAVVGLTWETAVKFLSFEERALQAFKACKAFLRGEIDAGRAPENPEYILVQSYGNREWTDKDAVKKRFKFLGDENILTEPELISPNKMEEAIKRYNKTVPKDQRINPKAAVNEFTVAPPKGKTLAINDGKRIPATPAIFEDYAV